MKRFLWILLLSIGGSLFLLYFYSRKIMPSVMDYCEIKTKKIINNVIYDSVMEYLNDNDFNDVYDIIRDNDNNIIDIKYDDLLINKMSNNISKIVRDEIDKLEDGDIDKYQMYFDNYKGYVYLISVGDTIGNGLLSNFSAKIPLKIKVSSNINSKIESDIKSYGINNAMIKLWIKINTSVKIILPFNSKNIDIDYEMPIFTMVINGKVPNYYKN